MSYEYRVIPAPVKGMKAKGVKTAQDRFALGLQEVMNQMAADGWEFQRAEALPSEERSGLTGTKIVHHNMLVFRRARSGGLAEFQPRLMEDTAGTSGAPAVTADRDAPDAQTPRPPLFAKIERAGKAPPVLTPQALSRSLKGDGSDTSRD